MKFTPKTEEELKKEMVALVKGMADFEIEQVSEEKSSNGNDMLKVTLKVWDQEGTEGKIWDYITTTAQWKLKQLLDAVGQGDKYETGEIHTHELEGKTGKLKIRIQKATGEYGEKPAVAEYVKKSGQVKTSEIKKQELPDFNPDEDVPDFLR